MSALKEAQDRAAKALAECRRITEASTDPDLSAEDQGAYDKSWAAYEAAKASVKRVKAEEAEARENAVPDDEPERPEAGKVTAEVSYRGKPLPSMPTAAQEYRQAWRNWALGGTGRGLIQRESRALQAESPQYGGYLVAPQQLVAGILTAVDNAVFIRQKATVFSVPNAESLGKVSLDNDPADPIWTTELLVGDEDSTMSFGKRELKPNPLAKYIKISNTLLRKTDVEAEVTRRLAYKFSVTQEANYLTGTGSGQPLGLCVASNDGISTGRDTTAAATTTFTADELMDVKYALKPQYRGPASWLLNRTVVKFMAKLKDGEGRYLLQPAGFAGNMAETILGIPYNESEYAPGTMTAGLYVALLGDFSFYYIADALDLSIQRIVELYAATNQTAFFARYEGDGMPVLEEAFSRLILHT